MNLVEPARKNDRQKKQMWESIWNGWFSRKNYQNWPLMQ